MAYTTKALVKAYLGISADTDDDLIDALIARAQAIIDNYTGRKFEAATATKYFTVADIEGRYLYLHRYDLLTVTALTNGDGSVIAAENYRLEPHNESPKWAIRLDKDTSWEWTDSDSEISIAGTWGMFATAPDDIAHAAIRLTSFLYRQKDNSQDVERPIITGSGVTIMPTSIPKDVTAILNKYRRRI